jgi:hypothetical protein
VIENLLLVHPDAHQHVAEQAGDQRRQAEKAEGSADETGPDMR